MCAAGQLRASSSELPLPLPLPMVQALPPVFPLGLQSVGAVQNLQETWGKAPEGPESRVWGVREGPS